MRPLVHHALKRHWNETLGKINIEEATQRAKAFAMDIAWELPLTGVFNA